MNEAHPDVYLFNPTCEYAIANGNPYWQPNQLLQKMESDLSTLPMFFAGNNDFIIVDKIPLPDFLESLKQLNVIIPDFILKTDAINDKHFLSIPKNKIIPWGWSPAVHKYLSPLKESCSIDFQKSPVFNWNPEHREITSRKFALGILKQLQSVLQPNYILPGSFTPKVCTTQNDFETAIQQWEKVMVKTPWSSSGRGLQPITKTPVHQKVWEKVMGIVKEQGYAIAEPLLERVHDLALLFELKKGKVEYLGISHFCTNNKGQYEGNYLNGMPLTLDKKISEFAEIAVAEIRQSMIDAIEASEMAQVYEGVFGIDMLIYLDANKEIKINPCLEINVRHTMGLLALRLGKIIDQNKKGFFGIFFQPETAFLTFKIEMENKYPLKLNERKIISGFVALTEANEETLFGAYLLI